MRRGAAPHAHVLRAAKHAAFVAERDCGKVRLRHVQAPRWPRAAGDRVVENRRDVEARREQRTDLRADARVAADAVAENLSRRQRARQQRDDVRLRDPGLQKCRPRGAEARAVVRDDVVIQHAQALERDAAGKTVARLALRARIPNCRVRALESTSRIAFFLGKHGVQADRHATEMLERRVEEMRADPLPAKLGPDDEKPDEAEGLVANGRDTTELRSLVVLRDEETAGIRGEERHRVVAAGIPAFRPGKLETEADLLAAEVTN